MQHESVFPRSAYEPLLNTLVAGAGGIVRDYLAGVPSDEQRHMAYTLMRVYEVRGGYYGPTVTCGAQHYWSVNVLGRRGPAHSS
jgi:hypothetical protein